MLLAPRILLEIKETAVTMLFTQKKSCLKAFIQIKLTTASSLEKQHTCQYLIIK